MDTRARFAALGGAPFDAGKRRPMKEWVVVEDQDWQALAAEALEFVAARHR